MIWCRTRWCARSPRSAQFQAGTNLKAWLFTIVRNTFYEQIRRRKREIRVLGDAAAQPRNPRSRCRTRGTKLTDLQAMIWTLPPLLREALILVGAQELTYDEAALVCNVPVGTVKARVSRGRAALAEAMRRAEGGQT